jgi:hypothetical protein
VLEEQLLEKLDNAVINRRLLPVMPKSTLRYQICVSGAARGDSIPIGQQLAAAAGREIVRRGHLVTTGATNGLPYYAAKAAKLEAAKTSAPSASRRPPVGWLT